MEERTRRILGVALIAADLFTALGGWSQVLFSFAMLSTYGGACTVTVHDELGQPVEGAVITVIKITDDQGYEWPMTLGAGTTDGNGYTQFGVAGDGLYTLKAETEGFSDIQEVYIGGGEPSSVTFTLHENDPGGNGGNDPVASQAPLLMGGALIAIGVVTIDPDRTNEALHRIISALGLVR